jgi:hypothetical protein
MLRLVRSRIADRVGHRFSSEKGFVILSGARSAQPKNLGKFPFTSAASGFPNEVRHPERSAMRTRRRSRNSGAQSKDLHLS